LMKYPDGEPLRTMDASKNGKLIITGGNEGQVQLWDGVERLLIASLRLEQASRLAAVALAPNGEFFVTAQPGPKHSTILVWPGPERWADIICSKLNTNMSPEEWQNVWPGLDYTKQCPNLGIAPNDPMSVR